MPDKSIRIYCDGGARGNPGPAAAAFVVVAKGKVIYKDSWYLGIATNNVAEYRSVIMALSWLVDNTKLLDGREVSLFLDSQLVARQLSGDYKIKSKKLRLLITKVKKLEDKANLNVTYQSVSRTKNRLADFLVNKRLDIEKARRKYLNENS